MNRFYSSIIIFVTMITTAFSQPDLSGISICLDPGHGGPYDKPFEGWINHQVAPFAEEFLLMANPDTVILTKRDSTQTMSLSQREYVANSNHVDFFHSIHHNAFNGQSNYTLALYEQLGTGGPPQWPGEADVMADTVSHYIWRALRTSYDAGGHGDMDFLGFNLGVLNDLEMPGDLSEGSFWDYPDEIPRLRNADYLRTEGEAIAYAFFRYYDTNFPLTASLTGIITNILDGKPVRLVDVVLLPDSLVYHIDNKGNGFYRFENLSPGQYIVRAISELDTVENLATVNIGEFNHLDLSLEAPMPPEPPDQPLLQWCVGRDSSAYIKWQSTGGEVIGYHLYYASTPDGFTGENFITVTGQDTFFYPEQINQAYYFYVKAFNESGESNNPSDTYGCWIGNNPYRVLVVDGFDRHGGSGSWPLPYHDFAARQGRALAVNNTAFDCIDNDAIMSYNLLSNYPALIWVLGDESTQDETFSSSEQLNLKQYLQQGGRLFVSGSEIAWDLDHRGSDSDINFIHNYLGCKYISDDAGIYTVYGDQGTFAEGLTLTYGGSNSPYPEDYPDVLGTYGNNSISFAHYAGAQKIAGTYFQGIVPGGQQEARVVVLGFPFETINQQYMQDSLMARILNVLNPDLFAIQSPYQELPSTFKVLNPYPNPFNSQFILPLQLTQKSSLELFIYDLKGHKLYTLRENNLSPGQYNLNIDFRTISHQPLPSGVYLVNLRLKTSYNTRVITKTITYLK